MGHERVGYLPKTKRWRDIVEGIAGFGAVVDGGGSSTGGAIDVSEIVQQTTDNLRNRFENLERDDSLLSAFRFLVCLPVAARTEIPREELARLGITVPADPSPISLAKALQQYMPASAGSLEYAKIAQNAAVDAIAVWSGRADRPEENLFGVASQSFDVWKKAADGAGFCELSRIFFGKFTERYLKYFLEREASAVLPGIQQRDHFSDQIGLHVDDVSRHAFETAKITQSFAAGWFNKHAKTGLPTNASMRGFLRLALGKLREEIRREGEK
jgi:hypothetical protein